MVANYDLTLDHRPSEKEILSSFSHPEQYREVVFSGYGEPTLRLNIIRSIATHIKQQGGKVKIETDGLVNLVHKQNVLPELAACVDTLSVSLNAQDKETYNRICQPGLPGSFEEMLEFLTLAPRYIKEVQATAVEPIDGVDINACREIAETRGVAFIPRILDVLP